MLEKAFQDVYTKFKLHFYQNVFQRFATREATLTTVESFCMEGIMAMGEPTIAEFSRMMQILFNLKSASGLKIPNSSVLKKNYYLVPKKYAVNGDDGIGVTRKTSDPNNKAGHEFVSLKSSLLVGDNYYVGKNTLSDGDILITKFGDSEQYRVHETGELSGVYYVNQGYCQFRPIEVLYKNKEYSIVSDHTVNGLSAYDHIVVDPTYLNDDDFIE